MSHTGMRVWGAFAPTVDIQPAKQGHLPHHGRPPALVGDAGSSRPSLGADMHTDADPG